MSQAHDPSRRDFLWNTGGGFGALALAALLAEEAQAAAPPTSSPGPLEPRKPHFPAKAKAVICLFMYGGVSQVDTWDPKPELTRRHGQPMPLVDPDLKVRNPGTLLGSSRTFAKHGQAGIEVSDLYPHLARQVDRLAVLRRNWTN